MNGSNKAAGRQDPASVLAAAGLSAAEEPLLDDGNWPWSSQGQCVVCRLKREATASCERPVARSQLQWATVCKDCCIAALDGHECRWWSLCWRDQEARREG